MPEFESESTARSKLEITLREVINNYQGLWKKKEIIKNPKITSILFHVRVPSIIGQKKIFSPGSQISITNTWANGFIKNDFENLRPLVEY